MVTLHDTERRSWPLLLLREAAAGAVAFAIWAAFGEWQLGILFAIIVMIGALTPPFSKWPRHTS